MAFQRSTCMTLRFAELQPEAKLRYWYLIVANETSADGQAAAASKWRLYPRDSQGTAVPLEPSVRVSKGGLKAVLEKAAGQIRSLPEHAGLDGSEGPPVGLD